MPLLTDLRHHLEQQGVRGVLASLADDPTAIVEPFRESPNHFYHLEQPVYREDVVTFVRPLVSASDERIVEVWRELEDGRLQSAVESRLRHTAERPETLHSNWRELLYTIIRLTEPETVVETGIFDGLSSAYILHALKRNDTGQLISIDINDEEELPGDIPSVDAGWLTPQTYHSRWNRQFGDAEDLLPEIVEQTRINCFLHDSLHTKAHMQFEFETAINGLAPGSVFVADNVRFTDVFWDFAITELSDPVFWKNTERAINYDQNSVDDRLGAGVVTDK